MGILNVTPDSFSDGGAHADPVAAGRALIEAGADILDIGGESTRPGASPVGPEEEQRRVLPVLRALVGRVPLSIDTRHAATMAAALDAGASIVNDISALRHDADSARVVAQGGAALVLMHMRGLEPASMQDAPRYGDVVAEVRDFLAARVADAEAAGIPRAGIAIDPGIGFGKTVRHNLALLAGLAALRPIGCAVLAGVSRKGFIGAVAGGAPVGQRLPGSLAAALAALARGASILRVHDVAATLQALAVWRAIDAAAAGRTPAPLSG